MAYGGFCESLVYRNVDTNLIDLYRILQNKTLYMLPLTRQDLFYQGLLSQVSDEYMGKNGAIHAVANDRAANPNSLNR